MRPNDNQMPLKPFASFARSLFGWREQVHSVEVNQESIPHILEFKSFQKSVTDRFQCLSVVCDNELLSIEWMGKLLDTLICCHEEFRAILLNHKEELSKPPADQWTKEFFERLVKALDICNASSDGIGEIRSWNKLLEIVLCALDSQQRTLGESQFRRARKALMDLALTMIDEKDSRSLFLQRNLSFGRHKSSKNPRSSGHSRSHSWSVSRTWSASKQLQAIASNLAPPRSNDIAATNGLALPIFTMSSVLLFVLWAMVAAIPCQDRGLNVNFSFLRQHSWGTQLISLHDRIMDESRKQERRNTNGLLKEIYQLKECSRQLTDVMDSVQPPLKEEQKLDVKNILKELQLVCKAFQDGLDPLERQVRVVFRKIAACRADGLEYLSKADHTE